MISVSSKKLCNKGLTSSSSSAAASTIGSNGNLLVDILYLLPANSLCVFKTVSKQWLSLISDPHFERNYNLRSRRSLALFMKTIRMTESNFETLVMDEQDGNYYVPFNNLIAWRICFEQSCNGLVLCKTHCGQNSGWVIYNPSTKHCRTLPSPPFRNTGAPHLTSVSIAFNPGKSSYYEVVGVCKTNNSDDVYLIEIYSSKTDTWRAAGDPFPFSEPFVLSQSGVYWNGSVHWINKESATLHYFDIHCELMKTTAMPTKPYSIGFPSREIVYFNECRGHIHLIEMCKKDMPRFDIWEMRTDYTGWNVRYHVDLTPLTTVYPDIVPGRIRPLILHPFELNVLLVEEGEEDPSKLMLLIGKNKVISFDLSNKSIKKLYAVSPDVRVHGFQYVETLVHA